MLSPSEIGHVCRTGELFEWSSRVSASYMNLCSRHGAGAGVTVHRTVRSACACWYVGRDVHRDTHRYIHSG